MRTGCGLNDQSPWLSSLPSLCLAEYWCPGRWSSVQTSLLLTTDTSSSWGILDISKPIVRYYLSSRSWVWPRVSIQWDTCEAALAGADQGASWTSVLKCRSSGSTPSLSQIVEITESKPSNPAEEPHSHCLYVQPYSFNHYPQLVTTGKNRDVDWTVNRQLSPNMNLLLHHYRSVQWQWYCFDWANPKLS